METKPKLPYLLCADLCSKKLVAQKMCSTAVSTVGVRARKKPWAPMESWPGRMTAMPSAPAIGAPTGICSRGVARVIMGLL
jgi:hypothetical protein